MRFSLLVLTLVLASPAPAGEGDVVINEIMYHPPGAGDRLQYLELFNRGESPVDLSGWSFTSGIKFAFPPNTSLAPGSYLVVCRDRAAFAGHYGAEVRPIGDFEGKLSHRGERVELSDARGAVIDGVSYSDRNGWPAGADGSSASLERICPAVSGSRPANWAASFLPRVRRAAGTPGMPNDNRASCLAPLIREVEFGLPVPDEKTAVTARVADAGGVREVQLLYRIVSGNGEGSEESLPM